MSTDTEQLEGLFDDLGLDVDLDTDTEIGVDTTPSSRSVAVQTAEVTVYESYDPADPEARTENITKNFLLDTGDQLTVHIFRRPECPSCGYVPTEEGEPSHLTGRCSECGMQTCPRCKNTCTACGRILCDDHTEGHGVVDETYCSRHVPDIENQIQHDREMERLQENRQERHQQLEHQRQQQRIQNEHQRQLNQQEWNRNRERRELDIKRQQKRFDNKLRAKKLLIQAWKAKQQSTQSRSYREKTEADHLGEIKEQADTIYNGR